LLWRLDSSFQNPNWSSKAVTNPLQLEIKSTGIAGPESTGVNSGNLVMPHVHLLLRRQIAEDDIGLLRNRTTSPYEEQVIEDHGRGTSHVRLLLNCGGSKFQRGVEEWGCTLNLNSVVTKLR
jgi:hypothetical protein